MKKKHEEENKVCSFGDEFDKWFDHFIDECRKLGHMNYIYWFDTMEDFKKGLSPKEAAKDYVNEFTS